MKYRSSVEQEHTDWMGRRAKTQKDGFVKRSFTSRVKSGIGKSSARGNAIVIVDDAAKDISAVYHSA